MANLNKKKRKKVIEMKAKEKVFSRTKDIKSAVIFDDGVIHIKQETAIAGTVRLDVVTLDEDEFKKMCKLVEAKNMLG